MKLSFSNFMVIVFCPTTSRGAGTRRGCRDGAPAADLLRDDDLAFRTDDGGFYRVISSSWILPVGSPEG